MKHMETEDLWGELDLTSYPNWDPKNDLVEQAKILELKSQCVVKAMLKQRNCNGPTLFPLPPENVDPWEMNARILMNFGQRRKKENPESPLSVVQEVTKELGDLGAESPILRIDFEIVLPSEDYSYHLFSIEHGIDFVPLVFRSESLRMYEIVDSPQQFKETLSQALQHVKTVALVKSMYNHVHRKANDKTLAPEKE